MHASLVEKDTREDVLLIKDTRSKEDMHFFKDNRTKATTGSSVSSLYPLKDFEDNGTESGFFVFPDLSVRMEGTYRLKFCLYEMVGKDVHFCAHVISDPLIVYSAKKFPGMEESTLLSQYFAEQGLKIRIRKEVRPKKRTRSNYITYGPTSQSPTDSQHQDQGDATESQDDEDAATVDVSLASKRRASGTRSIEPKRDKPSSSSALDRPRSAHGTYPKQGHLDDPAFAAGRSAASRAAEGVSHLDLNAGPRPEQRGNEYRSLVQDQAMGYERGIYQGLTATWQDTSGSHARAGYQARSPPSQMSYSLGRPQGQYAPDTPANPPFGQPFNIHGDGESSRSGPYSMHERVDPYDSSPRPGAVYARPQTGAPSEYSESLRRSSTTRGLRETGPDTAFLYNARGTSDSHRRPSDLPHSPPYGADERPRAATQPQPFASGLKLHEPPYSRSSRDYGMVEQRLGDHIPRSSYTLDHHRSSVSSNPYDRIEYQSRLSSAPAPQHGLGLHPPSQQVQYQPRFPRDQQYQDQGTHAHVEAQDQISSHRPHPYPEPYIGHGHSLVSPSHTAYGKYPASEGQGPSPIYSQHSSPGPHTPSDVELVASGKHTPIHASQEGPGSGVDRFTTHGPPSYKSSPVETMERQPREDLGTGRMGPALSSPPRPQEYSAQPALKYTSISAEAG
ncbi:hypothetical protein BGX28_000473 [Mortierella sp. GBA30]|nr:hypothetical protein BGX28_000473 [Mortierella sp. GBA30]